MSRRAPEAPHVLPAGKQDQDRQPDREGRVADAPCSVNSPGREENGALPEPFGYALKCRLLGAPLVNDRLQVERLSKPLGLGVLSCDGISSANYGSELILH